MIKDPKNITMKMGDTGYLVVNGKIEHLKYVDWLHDDVYHEYEQIENGWYNSACETLFKCKKLGRLYRYSINTLIIFG